MKYHGLTMIFALVGAVLFSMVGCAEMSNSVQEDGELRDALTGLPFTIEVESSTIPASRVMPAETIFSGFGCSGDNVSPALSWSEGPEGTKSYMVMMYDPDAPTGVGFHHWWVANLPTDSRELVEGAAALGDALPDGAVQGRVDYGISGYGGPCPPEGRTHRYEFYVWALGVESLPLDAEASPVVARFMVAQNALAVGRLVATYGR